MRVNKTVYESVELKNGELNVYGNGGLRVSLGIQVGDIDINIWVTEDEADKFADAIQKVLEQTNEHTN